MAGGRGGAFEGVRVLGAGSACSAGRRRRGSCSPPSGRGGRRRWLLLDNPTPSASRWIARGGPDPLAVGEMRGFQGDLGGMAAEVRHPRARVGSRRPPARKGVGIARGFQGLRAETRGGAFIRTGIETCRSTRACPRPRRAAGGLSSEQELRRDPEHVVGSCHVEPVGVFHQNRN